MGPNGVLVAMFVATGKEKVSLNKKESEGDEMNMMKDKIEPYVAVQKAAGLVKEAQAIIESATLNSARDYLESGLVEDLVGVRDTTALLFEVLNTSLKEDLSNLGDRQKNTAPSLEQVRTSPNKQISIEGDE